MPYEVNIPSIERLLHFDDDLAGINQSAADGLQDYLKAFFYRLDQDRANPLGGERSHFYRHAAETLTQEIRDDGADVVVNQLGIRQRLLGGEIHAKNSKYLTIPAIAEAYGHRAKEFDLHFIMFKTGSKALAANTKEDHRVWYWLVESVTQEPDPEVMPSVEAMTDAVCNNVKAWLSGMTLDAQTGSIYQGGAFSGKY